MKRVVSILLLFSALPSVAQTLTGRVVDEKGAPLPYVNVVALSPKDSVFLHGTTSGEDGSFTLSPVAQGDILRTTFIGYQTVYQNYAEENVLTIVLKEDAQLLSEAVVRASRPKTMLKGEGMITTVSGSVLEKTGSMEQLLNLIPRVSAQNGTIEVFGRGNPEIYINGRKMVDAMDLDRLRPEEIKNVEVITNPGARYNAATTSVIRITTKKPVGEGFSIDTRTVAKINEEGRTSGEESLRLNYRTGKWDVNAHLYGSYTHRPDDKVLRQETYLSDTWVQRNRIQQEYTNVNPYVRLAGSYLLNPENSVGASISYDRYAKNYGAGNMLADIWKNGTLTETSRSRYESPARTKELSSNFYYVGKVGKIGIDFNADYYWSGKRERMKNDEEYQKGNEAPILQNVQSLRRTYNDLLASKLVLSVPFWKGTFSVGGEHSVSKRKSFYNVVPQEVVDDEQSRIREKMSSAFVDYSRMFGRLGVQAGLRYEHIDFRYYDRGRLIPEQSKSYGDLFPSIAFSLPVGKTQMQLTYATDIYRPAYNQLRAGVQFDNRTTYESGNPFLIPSISKNLTYALSWKWLSFSTMFTHLSDEVTQLMQSYKDDPLKTLMRPENIPSYNKMQASLTVSPTVGIWQPSLEVLFTKQWYKMKTHGGRKLDNPFGMLKWRNAFDTKWGTAMLSLEMTTEGDMGNKHVSQGAFSADFSLYKSFLHDRLTVQLYVNDLLGTDDQKMEIYSGAQRITFYEDFSCTNVALTLRYRLNTSNGKYKGTGAGQAQKQRM